jgi:FAD:protein FMN transferase
MVASRRWSVWSTSAEVLVTDPTRLDEACAILEERIRLVGDACDRFRDDSEASRLRDRAAGGVRVSRVLADLVQVALDAAAEMDGVVDPTLGAAGAPVRRLGAWREVRLEDDRLFVPDGVELDLRATATARTADAAACVIAAVARCGVLVNLGGAIATRGPAPADGWQVTVQDHAGDPAARLSLPAGCGLATSSTRRLAGRPGRRMDQVPDARTGRPALPVWRSVAVVAHSTVTASTLSTAAIVDGSRAVSRLAGAGYPARLVDAAGGVMLLNGWPASELVRAA